MIFKTDTEAYEELLQSTIPNTLEYFAEFSLKNPIYFTGTASSIYRPTSIYRNKAGKGFYLQKLSHLYRASWARSDHEDYTSQTQCIFGSISESEKQFTLDSSSINIPFYLFKELAFYFKHYQFHNRGEQVAQRQYHFILSSEIPNARFVGTISALELMFCMLAGNNLLLNNAQNKFTVGHMCLSIKEWSSEESDYVSKNVFTLGCNILEFEEMLNSNTIDLSKMVWVEDARVNSFKGTLWRTFKKLRDYLIETHNIKYLQVDNVDNCFYRKPSMEYRFSNFHEEEEYLQSIGSRLMNFKSNIDSKPLFSYGNYTRTQECQSR